MAFWDNDGKYSLTSMIPVGRALAPGESLFAGAMIPESGSHSIRQPTR
jgi:hypothetical protein